MKKTWALFAMLIFLLMTGSNVLGCVCPSVSRTRTFKLAAAVFTGKVIDDQALTVTFEVSKFWKGNLVEKVTLQKGSKGTSCEAMFEQGASYLIYAFAADGKVDEAGKWSVNRCPGTWKVQQQANEIKALGKGQRPQKIEGAKQSQT